MSNSKAIQELINQIPRDYVNKRYCPFDYGEKLEDARKIIAGLRGKCEDINLNLLENIRVTPRREFYKLNPLLFASKHGNSAFVEALLEAGANPNIADSNGWTALHYAANNHDDEATRLLIAAGADVNAKTLVGVPPIVSVIQVTGHPSCRCDGRPQDVLNQLIAAGADLDVTVPETNPSKNDLNPIQYSLPELAIVHHKIDLSRLLQAAIAQKVEQKIKAVGYSIGIHPHAINTVSNIVHAGFCGVKSAPQKSAA